MELEKETQPTWPLGRVLCRYNTSFLCAFLKITEDENNVFLWPLLQLIRKYYKRSSRVLCYHPKYHGVLIESIILIRGEMILLRTIEPSNKTRSIELSVVPHFKRHSFTCPIVFCMISILNRNTCTTTSQKHFD